ncbi:MAG: ABC transporter ATP-binding protein [Acidobacteriota bacterium]
MANNGQPLVEVVDVAKRYRRGAETIEVLKQINLTMRPGDYLSLMGPSGSGKTTLLNLVAGIDTPTEGQIRVVGTDLSGLSDRRLADWRAEHIGFVFQLYNLIPVMSAAQNIEVPLLLTPLSRKQRREQVQRALRIVGLEDRSGHRPGQLSGGEQQRVAIARAIAKDPSLIVADEPTGDLDANSAEEILELLRRLNEEFNKSIIMVTHDPRAAARAGQQLYLDTGVLQSEVPQ